MTSNAFDNFHYGYKRLDALYIHFLEESDHKDELKELTREVILLQLVALIEAYKEDLTRQLTQGSLKELFENDKRLRKQILKHLMSASRILTSWDDLFEEMVDVALEKYKKGAFEDWMNKISKTFSFSSGLVSNSSQKAHFVEYLATRNIVAHHQGKITQRYLNRTKKFYEQSTTPVPSIGSSRSLDNAYCKNAMSCIFQVVSKFDQGAITMLT
ncbi:MAG: hypothetical protein ACPG8W_07655 [Candidatus Promineifilaceae bacterium]